MSEKLRKLVVGILLAWALLCGVRAQAQYNREYFFWVGRSCMMNNDYQEAIRTLNTLLRFDEKAYEGYFLRGIAKYNLDDLLGAEADFSTAIRLNPVYTQAYTYRAITRSRLGNYDDALQDFREAIELRPDLPGPYYSRGVTRLLNQQFREAIDDFDMFIRQETKVADAYICRGLSYLHLKDTTRAYDNFNLAIRTNREDPNGYNRRGGLHLEQEQYEEAEADFNKAIRCDSNYLLSYFNRALVYNATNRPMQALADFDKVIRLDSTNSLTYFNRAMLRTQIGDYNRALEDYDRVAPLLAQQRAGLLQPGGGLRPTGRTGEGRRGLHLGHRPLPRLRQRLHLPRTAARGAARPERSQAGPGNGAAQDRRIPLAAERQHLLDLRRHDAALRPPAVVRQQVRGRQLRPHHGPQRRTRGDAPAAAVQVHAHAARHGGRAEPLPLAACRGFPRPRRRRPAHALVPRKQHRPPTRCWPSTAGAPRSSKRATHRGSPSSNGACRRRSSSSTPTR